MAPVWEVCWVELCVGGTSAAGLLLCAGAPVVDVPAIELELELELGAAVALVVATIEGTT